MQLPCPVSQVCQTYDMVAVDNLSSFARSNLPESKNNLRAINGKENLSENPDDSKALMEPFSILPQEELIL